MQRSVFYVLALITLASTSTARLSAQDAKTSKPDGSVGRKINDFSLRDYRGRLFELAQFKEKQLLVVAFVGTECPLAKLYAPGLRKLARKYQDQVSVLLVDANAQDSITELAAFARRHQLELPVLKDVGNRVADQFGAKRTPEVFVLDNQRVVRYHGRIDNQYGIGYIRPQADQHFLRDALDQLLGGDPVKIAHSPAVGCHIGRVRKPKSDSDVTYANQISRILQARCVECHREGEVAPFALQDYEEVAGWAETIAEVVDDGRMPPWHATDKHLKFANDRRLSAEEKKLIRTWVDNGAPLGDPAQLPPAREFVSGWQLPKKPDLVISTRKTPYRVPATGAVEYQYFIVDPGFEKDQWVTAAQLLPGNRPVVHHILVFAVAPGERPNGAVRRGFLFAYAPGLLAHEFPEGMAKRIKAGSRLIFQVHYTPIGSVQEDISKLGLVFAKDPSKLRYEVKTVSAVNGRLRIPAHAENHRVTAVTRIAGKNGQLLLGFLPHMHLRGKSFRYEASFFKRKPQTQTLLDVPEYDFNWQTHYQLAEPMALPAGTTMNCTAHFDNSKNNLNNPNPSATVRWGNQTWEEMMIGYFDLAIPLTADDLKPQPRAAKPKISARTQRLMTSLDKNKDGVLDKQEVPQRFRTVFDRLDTDQNGKISPRELDLLRLP